MILLEGARRHDGPASRRPVNMVFQAYALFPHMTVLGERRVRPEDREGRQSEDDERVAEARRSGPARRLREAQAGPALGRPAAAGRARAGTRQPAGGAAARRAARRARPEAAQGDSARAEAHPGRDADDVRLRDARPGGGADDVRPHRGHGPGHRRAGGRAARALRAPGNAVRRRFHRRLERRSLCAQDAHENGLVVDDVGEGEKHRRRRPRRGIDGGRCW